MEYVGIQTQQSRNNMRSLLLLFLFPCVVTVLTFVFLYVFYYFLFTDEYSTNSLPIVFSWFVEVIPFVLGGVAIWFFIAFFWNTRIISKATNSQTLERKENKRVYNLVENLCMAQGMPMPKVNVIEDPSLNAFASGINDRSYTVTLTRGIINKLDDEELEGVIAHELAHIRNRDVRLLIVSIVFVGIFTMIMLTALHVAPRVRGKNSGGIILLLYALAAIAGIGTLCSTLLKFTISRKREYLADASAAEMTKKPQALANALPKISTNPHVASVSRDDVAQLFIEHSAAGKKKTSMFATHPPIENRIKVLEQF